MVFILFTQLYVHGFHIKFSLVQSMAIMSYTKDEFKRYYESSRYLSIICIPTTVITPLSYTARLGSVGIFHCAATENHLISWHVNGVPSSYPEVRNRQITTTDETAINATWSQSSLTVYASQENDELSIYCIAVVLGGPDGFSATATFHVQRHSPRPVNLTLDVSSNHRELILRWNFPSEMTIIVYTVYINITHTGTEFYFNTTMREHTIENPCSDVHFKVTAWDDLGEGNGTTLLYKHYSNGEKKKLLLCFSLLLVGSCTFQIQKYHKCLQYYLIWLCTAAVTTIVMIITTVVVYAHFKHTMECYPGYRQAKGIVVDTTG